MNFIRKRTLFKTSSIRKRIILHTPQTPQRFIIFFAILAGLALPFLSFAQTEEETKIPRNYKTFYEIDEDYSELQNLKIDFDFKPLDFYLNAHSHYCDSMRTLDFFETKLLKKKWWYYLPSVGVAFSRLTVGTNSNILIQLDQERQRKELLKLQIVKKWDFENLKAKAEIEKVFFEIIEIQKLILLQDIILKAWNLIDIDKRNYFVNTGNDPELFIKHQIAYLGVKQEKQNLIFRLQSRLRDLKVISKCDFF